MRHEAQGLESAGPLGLILEQESVHLELSEQFLSNGVVTAFGVPLAAIVATTEMNGQNDSRALGAFEARVVRADCLIERSLGV